MPRILLPEELLRIVLQVSVSPEATAVGLSSWAQLPLLLVRIGTSMHLNAMALIRNIGELPLTGLNMEVRVRLGTTVCLLIVEMRGGRRKAAASAMLHAFMRLRRAWQTATSVIIYIP